jgi:hypothetical protein
MAMKGEQTLSSHQTTAIARVHERLSLWSVLAQLAPFVLAFAAYLAVFLVMRPASTGDEPHYLLAAESIAYDGDVNLTNDYASRDRTLRVVNVFPLDPTNEAADYTGSGQLRPVHGVGLSALLAPAVALGGLTGARIAMVLMAALLADQLYRLLRDLRLRRRYRGLAWAAAVFCLPVLAFSNQIYPELPGALLLVVALRIMVAGASSPAALALGSAAAAALVWLHVRYLSLSIAVLVGLAFVAFSDRPSATGNRRKPRLSASIQAARAAVARYATTARKRWRTVTLPLLAPYAVGMAFLAITFQRWYGSPRPGASYPGNSALGSGGWNFVYTFVLTDLFNPVAGWIPYAPVHWLGLAALGCLVVWFGWRAAACVAVAAAYELLVASVGPSVGWGFPARYPLIVIPLIAIPIAVVIQEIRAALVVFVPLLAGSLVFAAAAATDYQALYPATAQPRLIGVRSIAPAFPTTQRTQLPTSLALAPGQFPPQTGRVRGNQVVAKAGRDATGFVLWGPYSQLASGLYRATFPLVFAGVGVGGSKPVATIEVVGSPPETVFARKVVTAAELKPRLPTDVTVQFTTPGGYRTETRVFYQGLGTLRAGPVQVASEFTTAPLPSTFPDWPLVFLWVAGTALVGWLFVVVMKLSHRHVKPQQRKPGDARRTKGQTPQWGGTNRGQPSP